MKKGIVLLLLILFFCGINHTLSAQNARVVYNFGYAIDFPKKVFYVSNIVEASKDTEVFYEPLDYELKNKWGDWLKTICIGKYYDYRVEAWVWSDYAYINNRRIEIIGQYKQDGFNIYYINDFTYIQKRRE